MAHRPGAARNWLVVLLVGSGIALVAGSMLSSTGLRRSASVGPRSLRLEPQSLRWRCPKPGEALVARSTFGVDPENFSNVSEWAATAPLTQDFGAARSMINEVQG